MKPYILSSSNIRGTRVLNLQREKIGNIQDLMIDLDNGEVLYAVLSFSNEIGRDACFPVPLQALIFSHENDYIQLDADEEVLENAPRFKRYNWPLYPAAEFIASIYNHFGDKPRVSGL